MEGRLQLASSQRFVSSIWNIERAMYICGFTTVWEDWVVLGSNGQLKKTHFPAPPVGRAGKWGFFEFIVCTVWKQKTVTFMRIVLRIGS